MVARLTGANIRKVYDRSRYRSMVHQSLAPSIERTHPMMASTQHHLS